MRDTIQVMRDGFPSDQLTAIINCLEADGYRHALFNGFAGMLDALANPRSGLLYLGVAGDDLPRLVGTIRSTEKRGSGVPVLVYFTRESVDNKEDLLVPEIDDYLLKPLNLQDMRLRICRLLQRVAKTEDEVDKIKLNLMSHLGMRQFIGQAPSFLAAIEKVPRVASCDATVLLTGETGTGKEMCARAIHFLSSRANHPFVPINCGSVPADLFENEVFGHEAGAFTDARQSRRGFVAEAEGGTLFLDEVDSLPPPAQVKLLRFLQDRQYKPLGASHYRQADVRLIAASNQNLPLKVQERSFREDLYYRLKVVSLWLPPLRERREDLIPLASHFLTSSAREYRRPAKSFTSDAIQKLMTYAWPGNVRELENIIRQAVILAEGPVIHAHDLQLPSDLQAGSVRPVKEPLKIAKARMIEAFERAYLNDLLAACGGNISKAAREAHKDRRTFFALLKKYNLVPEYRKQANA